MLAKLSVDQALKKARSHAKKGEITEAQKLYQAVLLVFPKNIRAQQGLTALNKPKQNNTSQSLPQETVDQLVNLYNQGQFSTVVEQAQALTEQYPKAFIVWNILGASTAQIGKHDEAIEFYNKSISLKPDYAEAYGNMGNALKDQGKLEEAIEAFHKALSLKPDYADAYSNMGTALQDQGKLDEAIEAYNKALSLKPDYAEAYCNMGVTLKDQGKLEEAIEVCTKSISLKPDYADAYINMGVALKDQGKLEEAIDVYNKALLLRPDYAEVYINMGNALQGQGKLEDAIDAFNKALLLKPDHEVARLNKLLNQASICDWTGVEEDQKLIPTIGISDQYINPMIMMAFEDAPERHRIRSELYAKKFKQKPIPMPPIPMQKPKRLRIGYFSSDFRAHSVIYTIADVFDAHDRERFEIYGYSFGPNDDSEIRKRIINTVDVFHDVKEMGDKDIALLARQDKIDIAIDINGYTKLCRPGIFAYRAAPIQIHFWGSANTSGTDFIDYYIADNIGIPVEHEHHWSESIIRLPIWSQSRHKNNYVSDQLITRKDMGLPEHGFIFCNFNNSYKLSPIEFDIWMRLLDQVEDSVLWLLKPTKWVEKNLQQEARKRGVAADRLVFAEKLPHPVHLARQKLADVFVDNFNVNAGVTLGDALWVGLPVVTKLGKQMPARVGGMVLASIDMPELITKTEQEYEALLLELATNSQRLSAIKEKLVANRLSTPLFNAELFTKHLENGYQQAYQRYFDGNDPEAISVPMIPI
jgi:predicted O-linked N-acetylglucosamine transferase (SPINDLY family)